MRMLKIFAIGILLVLSCTLVFSQEGTATPTTTTTTTAQNTNSTQQVPNIQGPSIYVQNFFLFPEHPELQLPAGEIIEVLLGFTNKHQLPSEEGEENVVPGTTYNVTMIFASLNHPSDFRYFIQNYSRFDYGVLVGPGEEATFSYRFRPDPLLEPRDFGLMVHVIYEDINANITHVNTFFNRTVEIAEPLSTFDLQLALTYVFAFVGIAAGAFFAYNKASGGKGIEMANSIRTSIVESKNTVTSSVDEGVDHTASFLPASLRKKTPKKTRMNSSQ
eukprot:TRINITY_DN4062_c0_g1_i1.p1 TRINITY_DN4062_c0_g1~~TRINITY_DN4062_c0_g1_i1.p1  ORF type:complete len:275 (-),score=82.34 TRINITY_DN4062_c0_g1_i1:25-849(-)